MKNNGKLTALVTGASSGIGYEFAKLLAEMGHDIIITARRKDRLIALAEEIETNYKVRVEVITADLSLTGASIKIFEEVGALGMQVDILINNAGVGNFGEFLDGEFDQVQKMLQVNVVAVAELCHLFAQSMRQNKLGYLLNVASIGAFQPVPNLASYAASKSYVSSLGDALYLELFPYQVNVTTLFPGPTRTEFAQASQQELNDWATNQEMSAEAVAQAGLDGLFKGKPHVTPGIMNKLSKVLTKHSPTLLSANIAGKIMKRSQKK